MRIGLLTDLAGQRVWHRWLATELARSGHDLALVRPAGRSRFNMASGVRLAFWLDPIWFRLRGEHAFTPLASAEIPEVSGEKETFDVLIDAGTGAGNLPSARRVLRLTFNGGATELAAVAAALDEVPLDFAIEEQAYCTREIARPGCVQRGCLTVTLNNLFSSVVNLLAARVASALAAGCGAGDPHTGSKLSNAATAGGVRYIADLVGARVHRYLTRHTRTPNSWVVALRRCDGPGLAGSAWPARSSFDVLRDDGKRFYADPFVIEHQGRRHVFAEEFPLATRRGLISVAEIDERGVAGDFRPVLERDCHLSYPFVFEHDGHIWMVPEASAGGTVDLYRAVEYPYRWVLDRNLLEIPGCDATIVPLGGAYGMLLTVKRGRESSWDALRVFLARSPLGPWTEQPGGIARIDCTNARPAGPYFKRGADIVRPAQDSSRFYGCGMTLLKVESADGSQLCETTMAHISVSAPSAALGTHTYARSANFEVVDVYGNVRDLRRVTLECRPANGANTAGPDKASLGMGTPDG